LTLTAIEVIGVVFGLGYVVFAIRESSWCWPSGIVGALAYVVFFHQQRLPGQAALQAILTSLCVYGWWHWRRGESLSGRLAVTRARPTVLAATAVAVALGGLALGVLLRQSTDGVAPFVDGGLVAASLAAQWMAARKWLENWVVWIAVNVVSIALFASQGHGLTTGLYLLYRVMAFVGYRSWKRSPVASA
jgi:nicotinamide mononucleotide transporter